MSDQVTRPISDNDLPDSMAGGAADGSLLVDSAISHCEKLMRVMKLEEWISGARDDPILARACRRWQEELTQLLTELHLDGEVRA